MKYALLNWVCEEKARLKGRIGVVEDEEVEMLHEDGTPWIVNGEPLTTVVIKIDGETVYGFECYWTEANL